MENLEIKPFFAPESSFWAGKRILLTGHTGFKGGWLALWLADMGAKVHGYALEPPTEPNIFNVGHVREALASHALADVRDAEALAGAMQRIKPEIVFHLAAQPLVRQSYTDPVGTYATNVMGTVNLLEAIRQTPGVRAAINVTTDKCYENHGGDRPYRENEALGGYDPYSSSKACSELVTAAYRNSFFRQPPSGAPDPSRLPFLASARAGNVIGGGDWGMDRLVPDFLRALDAGKTLFIRSPAAVRPWQHVLEPLSGYLTLARALYERGAAFAEAWNFGPEEGESRSVQWIVEHLCAAWPKASWQCDPALQPHEAQTLRLDSSKALTALGWRSRWNLQAALGKTLEWHQAWRAGGDMADKTLEQIHQYTSERQA